MSWLNEVHEQTRLVEGIERRLWRMSSALREVGLRDLSDSIAECAYGIEDARKKIRDACHGKVDGDVRDAEKNSAAMLQMALMTVEVEAKSGLKEKK